MTLVVEAVVMAERGFSLFDQDSFVMVKIEGSARVETAVLLKQNLAQTEIAHPVVIDWGEAEHVDACVLQVLLALRKVLAGRGLSLMVDKDNARVRGYLKLSGLSECFPVRDPPHQAQPAENPNA